MSELAQAFLFLPFFQSGALSGKAEPTLPVTFEIQSKSAQFLSAFSVIRLSQIAYIAGNMVVPKISSMNVFIVWRKIILITCFFLVSNVIFAQEKSATDSTSVLPEVLVHGYLSARRIADVSASIAVLTSAQIALHPNNSLVSAVNTLPGVRMEERTPGSYRLSLRGSTFRSPFGIRNVKIYMDEIPLTDASGNTYLNAIDLSGICTIEVMKGPDGSLFGANSGGVLLLDPMNRKKTENSAEIQFDGGSYGLTRQSAKIQHTIGKNQLEISQAYQGYDGYREHSNMHRRYFQLANQHHYGKGNVLKFFGFYSNLDYQTPGGLTLEQFRSNPKSARPATPFFRSVIEQHNRIRSNMILGGFVNEAHLSAALRNVTAIFGSNVDLENPFITNFEQRWEKSYGARSYFEYTKTKTPNFKSTAILGAEWQRTTATINNYDNLNGAIGNPQAFDDLVTTQHFIFARYTIELFDRLNIEVGASLNEYRYTFRNQYPYNDLNRSTKKFEPQFMPRLAASYHLKENLIWRSTVSRGYSPPTSTEVRSSDTIVNTELEPESGWNFETGFRFSDKAKKINIDASLFYYRLDHSIVNRRLPNDIDFFVNAGGTEQLGLELDCNATILKNRSNGFIRQINMNQAVTANRFRFKEYSVNGNDYSGNDLTGTPLYVFVTGVHVLFPKQVYLYVNGNFTGRLPLNDGNTAYASAYELIQAKVGWSFLVSKTAITIHTGADNLLNQRYSLGNDLNAFGNRFYNPAPDRNVYFGIQVKL